MLDFRLLVFVTCNKFVIIPWDKKHCHRVVQERAKQDAEDDCVINSELAGGGSPVDDADQRQKNLAYSQVDPLEND